MYYTKVDKNGVPDVYFITSKGHKSDEIPKGMVHMPASIFNRHNKDALAQQWTGSKWIDYVEPVVDIDPLPYLKQAANNEIRYKFKQATLEPIVIDGVEYHGDFESWVRLNEAKNLAVMAKVDNVVFYAVDNTAQKLTLNEAKNIVLIIGSNYQMKLARKQQYLNDIENIADINVIKEFIVEY
jgi:hypothetical protein